MPAKSLIELDHQLEKLEFALAISRSRGDKRMSDYLLSEIDKIGQNFEEPGT
tara:strand:+ start:627 stop:782 length:156 start_codon:yes stop_codon:yes gene_type:complete